MTTPFFEEVKTHLKKSLKYPVKLFVVEKSECTVVHAEMTDGKRSFFTNEEIMPGDTPEIFANAIVFGILMNIQSWNIE